MAFHRGLWHSFFEAGITFIHLIRLGRGYSLWWNRTLFFMFTGMKKHPLTDCLGKVKCFWARSMYTNLSDRICHVLSLSDTVHSYTREIAWITFASCGTDSGKQCHDTALWEPKTSKLQRRYSTQIPGHDTQTILLPEVRTTGPLELQLLPKLTYNTGYADHQTFNIAIRFHSQSNNTTASIRGNSEKAYIWWNVRVWSKVTTTKHGDHAFGSL